MKHSAPKTPVAYDPFSAQPNDPGANPNRPRPASSSKVLLVLAIIAGSMLVICCGFAGLGAITLRSYTHPADIVELPTRDHCFADDSSAFQASILQLNLEAGQGDGIVSLTDAEKTSPQIVDFVRDVVGKIDRDEEVPFSIDMFIEAIDASRYYRGSMSMIERLTMASWLRDYAPVPDSTDRYYRVLGFRLEGERLAEVDLLFYSENNQPMSVRWFLVNGNNQADESSLQNEWQIYDHARLEDGRRKSDEYANYLKGSEHIAEGYDEAISDAYEVSAQWDWELPEESIAKLKKCESARMLSDDRDLALLRFSYIYLENNQEKEAIRVLKKIQKPDQTWGVWPMLAICYSNLEKFKEANECLWKAQGQASGHPRNQWLAAEIDSAMDRDDAAADHRANALATMPQDTTLFMTVAGNHRVPDIPVLMSAADFSWKQRRQMNGWLALINALTTDSEFAKEVELALQNSAEVPSGIATMVSGSVAWANDDTDTAAKSFMTACKEADHDEIKQAAREKHRQCRFVDNKFFALLSETDDVDATLLTMLEWAYDEEFNDSASQLIDDLKRTEEFDNGKITVHPIATAIRGWAQLQLGQHEAALSNLDLFAKRFESLTNSELSDKADWVTGYVDTLITQCLLNLDRTDEVVKRFANEPWRLDAISDWYINHRDTEKALDFVQRFESDPRDVMQLQTIKLKALLATSSGNAKESSKNHKLAVQLGEQIAEDHDNYWPGDLIRNYAKDMVQLKAMPTSVDSPSEQLCQQVIAEAQSVEDGNLIRAWNDQALGKPDLDPAIRLRIAKSLGDYHLSQGEYQDAIKAFEARVDSSGNDDQGLHYHRKRLSDAKILSQLAANKISDARKALEELDESVGYSSIDLPPLAIADLAEWDVESLRKQFGDLEASEVASWFVESPRRRFFEQKRNDHQFDQLLDDYPMPIGYHQPQQLARLVFSSQQTPSLTEEIVKSACTDALGVTSSVSVAATVQSESGWIACTDGGDRILITIGEMVLSASTLRLLDLSHSDHRQRADGRRSLSIVTIAILDYAPKARKRAFDISQRLAALADLNRETNRIIAFSQSGRVWTVPEPIASEAERMSLANQLRWRDRVPVNFQTLDHYLSGEFELDSDPAEVKKSIQWIEVLNETNAPPGIFARHSCGDVWERLPVDLLSVDRKKGEANVRLQKSSAVSSYLRAGKICTCQTVNLRMANPRRKNAK